MYLAPAIVKGVVALHTRQSLDAVEPSQRIHFPPVDGHLVPPAAGGQRLNLDPLVQSAVILPHVMLRLFASCGGQGEESGWLTHYTLWKNLTFYQKHGSPKLLSLESLKKKKKKNP